MMSRRTTQTKFNCIPKSAFRRQVLHVWHSITSTSHPLRIQKKALFKLHKAVEQQLLECIRAAQKINRMSKRKVLTAQEMYLTRCLLFSSISKQSTVMTQKSLADNACRELAKRVGASLSKKKNTNVGRRFSAYDEIRFLLSDLLFEVMPFILDHHDGDTLVTLKEIHVEQALRAKHLRPHYFF